MNCISRSHHDLTYWGDVETKANFDFSVRDLVESSKAGESAAMCDCHQETASITVSVQLGTKTNDCINVVVRAARAAVVLHCR